MKRCMATVKKVARLRSLSGAMRSYARLFSLFTFALLSLLVPLLLSLLSARVGTRDHLEALYSEVHCWTTTRRTSKQSIFTKCNHKVKSRFLSQRLQEPAASELRQGWEGSGCAALIRHDRLHMVRFRQCRAEAPLA